jgi:hypothetical protein
MSTAFLNPLLNDDNRLHTYTYRLPTYNNQQNLQCSSLDIDII